MTTWILLVAVATSVRMFAPHEGEDMEERCLEILLVLCREVVGHPCEMYSQLVQGAFDVVTQQRAREPGANPSFAVPEVPV